MLNSVPASWYSEMTDSARLKALSAELWRLPIALMVTQLSTRTFVTVNDAAADLFGVAASELVGKSVIDHIHPAQRQSAANAYAAMGSGAVDGYRVERAIVRPDGTELSLHVWGRRLESDEDLLGLWALSPRTEKSMFGDEGRAANLVFAVTDHDWQLQYVSADRTLLGDHGSSLTGAPLLGLVHPSAVPDFLTAISRAVTDQLTVAVVTQLRMSRDRWVERHCSLSPLCEHDPPRLGIVVTAAPSAQECAGETSHHQVHHVALGSPAGEALHWLAAISRYNATPELSGRQVEVLSGLISGQSANQVARSLYLSPSTVRNHLTAIYRKFGVHSQSELLASLLRLGSADDISAR